MLRVGADAICEKPLVINPWNLDALQEIERETGGRVNTYWAAGPSRPHRAQAAPHVMTGTRIGKSCNIGQNVVISPEVVIGNDVKIHNNVSVYTGVVLEDDVFCGPPWSYQRFQSSEPCVPKA